MLAVKYKSRSKPYSPYHDPSATTRKLSAILYQPTPISNDLRYIIFIFCLFEKPAHFSLNKRSFLLPLIHMGSTFMQYDTTT